MTTCHNNKISTLAQRVTLRAYPDIQQQRARNTPAKISKDAKRKTMIRRKIEDIQEARNEAEWYG